jgi:isopenicillin N synthase-like dioxygenase
MHESPPFAPGSVPGAFPVIDMAPLFERSRAAERAAVARAIEVACRDTGFFYVTGHGIAGEVVERLDVASRRFFALPLADKMQLEMARGGRAWRGYFPVGGELTSGRPDMKEGLYLGTELPAVHPRVQAGWPLHGANLWPAQVPELRAAALDYMAATTRAAHALMEGVALSLDLDDDYFARHYTAEPTVLFRIFHYPPDATSAPAGTPTRTDDRSESWGVGEHTDYGLLTLLAQDEHGGLQVKTPRGWVDAPPLPGTLVCNIGDMLDRMSGGWFRSTPHRVRNVSGRDRLSFPLFFDPDFAAEVLPLPHRAVVDDGLVEQDRQRRWDGASVHVFEGTYGDYLMAKMSRVFPQLGGRVL